MKSLSVSGIASGLGDSHPASAWAVPCEPCCLLFLVISPPFEAGEVITFHLHVFPLSSNQTVLAARHNLWAGYIHFQRINERVEFLCKAGSRAQSRV